MVSVVLCLALSQLAPPVDVVPDVRYGPTPAEWAPLGTDRASVLDGLERLTRAAVQFQDESGAFIDPVLGREFQYATPYLAYGIGALVDAGRADDLLDAGIRAMDHATEQFSRGNVAIPDQHGEFFIAPLAGALGFYEDHVDRGVIERWRTRLRTPIDRVIENRNAKTNNWRTYAMKGEWLRHRAGLVSRDEAVEFIEDAWLNRSQRARVLGTKYFLYQDWNGDPQSHAVEAVGRGNLLALVAAGYDGPSAGEIRAAVEHATHATLLMQDPRGQCPPNGRTDNHVFNDVLYALAFAVMSGTERARGEDELAARYRRGAALGYASVQRWWRDDGEWANTFSITKNFFEPTERVNYQPASQFSNYTGAMIYHLAELADVLGDPGEELPTPAETGSYTIVNDAAFGSAILAAGGMQVVVNLRGDTVPKYGDYWTPMGVVRLSRAGWSSPFGLYDGAHERGTESRLSLASAWEERGAWVRLADRAVDYRGVFLATSIGPERADAEVTYAPVTGVGGPAFSMKLEITPGGLLVRVTSANRDAFGLTLPVCIDDGRSRATIDQKKNWIRVGAGANSDSFEYVLIEGSRIARDGDGVSGGYGWLQPFRAETVDGQLVVQVRLLRVGEPASN